MDILVIVILALAGTFCFTIVYFLMFWIQPTRTSPAIYFVRAKRKNKPVVVLDDGAKWLFVVGETEGDGWIMDKAGGVVFTTPGSVKYSHGVRMAVGEAQRSVTANPEAIEIVELAVEKKIKDQELKDAISKFEENKINAVKKEKAEADNRTPESNGQT